MTNLSLLDRRRNEAAAKLDRATKRRDAALATLCREQAKLPGLERALRRYEAKLAGVPIATRQPPEPPGQADAINRDGPPGAGPGVPEPVVTHVSQAPTPDPRSSNEVVSQPCSPLRSDNLDIPGFLRRKPLDATAQAIADEQAEHKRAKSRGRIAKLKAKQSGELRRMPLEGRAALAAIRARG